MAAADGLSDEGTARDQDFWRNLFCRQVAANVRYWTQQIADRQGDAPRLYAERHNIVKALNRALQVEAAWAPAVDLLLTFHPYMERRGVMAEWEQYVEASLEISRRQDDQAAEAALLDRLGEVKRDQGDWAQAVTCHERACRQHETLGDIAGQARALGNLGQVYRLQRRFPEARQALEAALDSRQPDPGPEIRAFLHTTLGLVQHDEYQHTEAITSFQTAHQLWSQVGNVEGMARTRHNLGLTHLALGDWPQAESSLRSAITLYEQTRSRLYLAIASMDLGNVYLEQGRPEEAEILYRQARGVMEGSAYSRGLAQVFNNLGMACARQEKWSLAEEFFGRSIALWRQLGEPVSQANAEDNLAEVYLDQAKWDAAQQVLDKALGRLAEFPPEGRVADLLSDVNGHLREVEAGLDRIGAP
jgi:tetratricopeptide (TPR) repeat protein